MTGSGKYENSADAAAAHCQDDLQCVHLLQYTGTCGISSRQNYKSGTVPLPGFAEPEPPYFLTILFKVIFVLFLCGAEIIP
jgi:hypothetical protein